MKKTKIGLLSKKRGNYKLQERISNNASIIDLTNGEVAHHKDALIDAGYEVEIIKWGLDSIDKIKNAEVDIVFNVSSLVEASILEEYQIPFVGSGTDGIVLARNKALAKKLWIQNKIPTSEFIVFNNMADCHKFIANPSISYPFFVKPVSGRGSAGISSNSKIMDGKQLVDQVEMLLNSIRQPVIVEKYLEGREVTIGIIGNGENLRTLPPLEIKFNGKKKFLTFDKKENDSDEFICPANLSHLEKKSIDEYAKKAFSSLGLRDFGRIDTKLTSDGFILLEVNSFAGLSCTPPEKPHSYFGFMARAEGNGGKELIKEIVDVSMERINNK